MFIEKYHVEPSTVRKRVLRSHWSEMGILFYILNSTGRSMVDWTGTHEVTSEYRWQGERVKKLKEGRYTGKSGDLATWSTKDKDPSSRGSKDVPNHEDERQSNLSWKRTVGIDLLHGDSWGTKDMGLWDEKKKVSWKVWLMKRISKLKNFRQKEWSYQIHSYPCYLKNKDHGCYWKKKSQNHRSGRVTNCFSNINYLWFDYFSSYQIR